MSNPTSPPSSKADRIVAAIKEDFTDRRGLRQAWDGIDEDIQEQIVQQWTTVVEQILKEPEA